MCWIIMSCSSMMVLVLMVKVMLMSCVEVLVIVCAYVV